LTNLTLPAKAETKIQLFDRESNMLSCLKATQLISKQLDQPLLLSEKVQLVIHLFNCQECKLFELQLLLIESSIRELASETMAFKQFQEIGLPGLTSKAKARILQTIHSKLH